ncbi:MAG TPA: quinone-dependent dihydroorotate dehydrogenase [Thermoanaerobaculia bacterium]|nr:quinone-dependent dihydroorotate dehydrogenase [Thermoanaerobaculia bacterium]
MYPLIRRALFRLDAEDAHEIAAEQMMRLQRSPVLLGAIERLCRPPAAAARTLFGLRFPSPIGLAAGFDKNATMMPFLAALGFGFLEVGTVTLRPQSGNPRPRLFRYPRARALVNRMGFNNDGADVVRSRIREWRRTVPLLVNIGKNRATPVDRAADEYAECYRRLSADADAIVLNLSSPNTPGLRDLQRPEQMETLLNAIRSIRTTPILVKISPDLDDGQINEICDLCRRLADGMICTNTTTTRLPEMTETGGVSGAPLAEASTDVLRKVRRQVGPAYPLIGVGGVFTAADVRSKFEAGADLIQIYTGFVYDGPALPRRLAREVGTIHR